jgi:hypothetical protein
MGTRYCGLKNGFNRTGDNDVTPMLEGASTKYMGRGALPKKLMVPNGFAEIDDGNRRLAKSRGGDGGGMGTSMRGTNAFTKGKRK